MSSLDPLTNRLRSGTHQLVIPPVTRARHLAVITAGLEGVGSVVLLAAAQSKRRRAAAVMAAALVIGPGGVAAASASSVPGDPLYPAKRVVERVVAVFDHDIVAGHRLDELSVLTARMAEESLLRDVREEAEAAIEALPEGHPLRAEFEAIAARGGEQPDEFGVEPAGDDHTPPAAVEAENRASDEPDDDSPSDEDDEIGAPDWDDRSSVLGGDDEVARSGATNDHGAEDTDDDSHGDSDDGNDDPHDGDDAESDR